MCIALAALRVQVRLVMQSASSARATPWVGQISRPSSVHASRLVRSRLNCLLKSTQRAVFGLSVAREMPLVMVGAVHRAIGRVGLKAGLANARVAVAAERGQRASSQLRSARSRRPRRGLRHQGMRQVRTPKRASLRPRCPKRIQQPTPPARRPRRQRSAGVAAHGVVRLARLSQARRPERAIIQSRALGPSQTACLWRR